MVKTYTIRLYHEKDADLIRALDSLAEDGPYGAQIDAIRKALRAWFLDDTAGMTQPAAEIDYGRVRQIVQAAIQDELSQCRFEQNANTDEEKVSSALDALGQSMFE
jgi:Arc/MetJ-type ribon-helix-helix transcriptional regulator